MALLKYDSEVIPLINEHYGYTFQPGRGNEIVMRGQPQSRYRWPHQHNRAHNMQQTINAWRNLSSGNQTAWDTFASTYPQDCKNPDSGYLSGYQNFLKRQNYQFLNYNPAAAVIENPSLTEFFMDPFTRSVRLSGSELFIDYEFTNWTKDNIVSLFLSFPKSLGLEYQRTQPRYVGYITNIPPVDVIYGAIYNWYAANNVLKITSTGWHVPTKTEILSIFSYYDSSPSGEYYTSGRQLKESGLTHWDSPNQLYANNLSGLTLRGGGERDQYIGEFYGLKEYSNWWLSSVESGYYGDGFYTDKDSEYIWPVYLSADSDKQAGWYIRPVKDSTTLLHGQTGIYTGNDGKTYPTVAIGNPAIEIVAANIAETKYRDGSFIPGHNSTYTDEQWSELTSGAMCFYDNDIDNAYTEQTPPISLDITQLYQYHFGLLPAIGKNLLFRAVPMAIKNGQFFEQIREQQIVTS